MHVFLYWKFVHYFVAISSLKISYLNDSKSPSNSCNNCSKNINKGTHLPLNDVSTIWVIPLFSMSCILYSWLFIHIIIAEELFVLLLISIVRDLDNLNCNYPSIAIYNVNSFQNMICVQIYFSLLKIINSIYYDTMRIVCVRF